MSLMKRSFSTSSLLANESTDAESGPLLQANSINQYESATTRYSSFDHFCWRFLRAVFFSLLLMLVGVQGAMSMVWGNHWVGLAFAIVLLFAVIITIIRTFDRRDEGATALSFEIHRAVRVLWALFIVVLSFFAILFLTIYVFDEMARPDFEGFPTTCEHATNCVRLVVNESDHFSMNLSIPVISGKNEDEIQTVIKFQVRVQLDSGIFTHSVFTSVFFGFMDDFFTRLTPYNETAVAIDIQSSSRVTIHDFGVNYQHVSAFLAYIDKAFAPNIFYVDRL